MASKIGHRLVPYDFRRLYRDHCNTTYPMGDGRNKWRPNSLLEAPLILHIVPHDSSILIDVVNLISPMQLLPRMTIFCLVTRHCEGCLPPFWKQRYIPKTASLELVESLDKHLNIDPASVPTKNELSDLSLG